MASMAVPPRSFVLTFCWASVCWRGSKKITRGICLITFLIRNLFFSRYKPKILDHISISQETLTPVPSLVLFLVLLLQIETQFLEARNRFLRLLTEARPCDHDHEPGVALDQDL